MNSDDNRRERWLGNPLFTSSLKNWHRWVACHSQAYWICQASMNSANDYRSWREDLKESNSVGESEFYEQQRSKRAATPIQLIDIRYRNDNVTSASERAPRIRSKHQNAQENAALKYGDNHMKVLTLNNNIDADFNSFVGTKKPKFWPVIPFNL